MAQRRPLTSHPVFVPLLALWFAALFGLAVAVLPGRTRTQLLAVAGLDGLGPVIASVAAGAAGLLLGLAMAVVLARRGARDPRPFYAEEEAPGDRPDIAEPVRRPLHVLEEVNDEFIAENPDEIRHSTTAEAGEGFMILGPQPAHPPQPAPDLEGLLAQFDTALAAFQSPDKSPEAASSGPDPVHAFVARQTGGPVPSPLGGDSPDHQAELRAALDKLARTHRKD